MAMAISNTDFEVIVPEDGNLESFFSTIVSQEPFNDSIIGFVDSFSKEVLGAPNYRRYPELISLAFWMRKARVESLKKAFVKGNQDRIKVARGTVLHFAPSNVDTIFVYSLFLSLLAGNRNIMRLSSEKTPQQIIITEILQRLLSQPQHQFIRDYLLIGTYAHNSTTTRYLSCNTDCRVIWGGDETIATISGVEQRPTATELKFANKYSIAVVNAKTLLTLDQETLNTLVHDYVNDAYWFGQMGCSSPRTLVWVGEHNDAIERFWVLVDKNIVSFEHDLDMPEFINKVVAAQLIATQQHCHIVPGPTNLVTRIRFPSLDNHPFEAHCGGGLFFEVYVTDLTKINTIFSRNIQTVAHYGFSKKSLLKWILNSSVAPDRFVPIGKALDFDVVWDGYDLLESFTREVVLE